MNELLAGLLLDSWSQQAAPRSMERKMKYLVLETYRNQTQRYTLAEFAGDLKAAAEFFGQAAVFRFNPSVDEVIGKNDRDVIEVLVVPVVDLKYIDINLGVLRQPHNERAKQIALERHQKADPTEKPVQT